METDLERLIEIATKRVQTPEDREEQRINFAYGNAPEGDRSTKESVRAASEIMKAR